MAVSQVLASSVSSPVYNPSNWDLIEMTRYYEGKCFTYDGKRIKWTDSFEILKTFVECAIGQTGKWLSPGGKYRKFASCNTDLTLTWNCELGLLSLKGTTGAKLENPLVNMSTGAEVGPAVSVDCSTLADLEGFIDKSYQNLLPQIDNENISCTPIKKHATDNLTSLQEQFKIFKEKLESTVSHLVNKISQQTQIIDQNKQKICKLANDNLHLKSRVAELESIVFSTKDESIILIKPTTDANISHNLSENTPQPVVSTELSKLKDDCRPATSYNVEFKAAPSKSFPARPSESNVVLPRSSLAFPSKPPHHKKIIGKPSRKSNKAMIPCPFLKRRAYCLKGNECDFLHENVQHDLPKWSSPLNLAQPYANQVPFFFDLNYHHYFPRSRNPMICPPFPGFYYPLSPPPAPLSSPVDRVFLQPYPEPLMEITTQPPLAHVLRNYPCRKTTCAETLV